MFFFSMKLLYLTAESLFDFFCCKEAVHKISFHLAAKYFYFASRNNQFFPPILF